VRIPVRRSLVPIEEPPLRLFPLGARGVRSVRQHSERDTAPLPSEPGGSHSRVALPARRSGGGSPPQRERTSSDGRTGHDRLRRVRRTRDRKRQHAGARGRNARRSEVREGPLQHAPERDDRERSEASPRTSSRIRRDTHARVDARHTEPEAQDPVRGEEGFDGGSPTGSPTQERCRDAGGGGREIVSLMRWKRRAMRRRSSRSATRG
jgi:hypothetical protein